MRVGRPRRRSWIFRRRSKTAAWLSQTAQIELELRRYRVTITTRRIAARSPSTRSCHVVKRIRLGAGAIRTRLRARSPCTPGTYSGRPGRRPRARARRSPRRRTARTSPARVSIEAPCPIPGEDRNPAARGARIAGGGSSHVREYTRRRPALLDLERGAHAPRERPRIRDRAGRSPLREHRPRLPGIGDNRG